MKDHSTPAPGRARAAVLLRIAVLVGLIVLATAAVHQIRDALDLTIMPTNEQQVHRALMMGMSLYVLLLAMPFVPGAEIGFALLAGFGAAIAPLVYVATVLSMMLAFAVGRVLPVSALARLLRVMRMRRAADLVDRAAPLDGDGRVVLLLNAAPARAAKLAMRNRYLALAIAVNTPGNSIVGGGGGIMLMAGLSGIFAPLPTFLAVALATSPVPLAVMFLGLRLSS